MVNHQRVFVHGKKRALLLSVCCFCECGHFVVLRWSSHIYNLLPLPRRAPPAEKAKAPVYSMSIQKKSAARPPSLRHLSHARTIPLRQSRPPPPRHQWRGK